MKSFLLIALLGIIAASAQQMPRVDNGMSGTFIDHGIKQAVHAQHESNRRKGNSALQVFPEHSMLAAEQQDASAKRNATAESVPAIIWQKALGGSGDDRANSIVELRDGSLAVAGYTLSKDGDVSSSHGGYDAWVVKLSSADSSIIWQKALGGSDWDAAGYITELRDGSLAVAVRTNSKDGDVSDNHGEDDAWVVKLSSTDGSILWQKTLGGSGNDYAYSITELRDGSLAVAGYTLSDDGDLKGAHGHYDGWVLKLSTADGSILWQKALGGSDLDVAISISELRNGSLAVAGWTASKDGDVSGNHGEYDAWVLNLSAADGSIIWQKALGGSRVDAAEYITELRDGTLAVTGETMSYDGDVSDNHGGLDAWVLNLSAADGSIIWQKALGGSDNDGVYSLTELRDGTLAVSGETASYDGDVKGAHGGPDAWVVNLSAADGSIIWQKTLGGSGVDYANSITELRGGSLAVAGGTNSGDGDAKGAHGGEDVWVVKLDKSANDVRENNAELEANMLSIHPNPSSETALITVSITEPSSVFLRLYSVAGQLLDEHDLSGQTGEFASHFSLSGYDAGLYFIELQTPSKTYREKFVKVR